MCALGASCRVPVVVVRIAFLISALAVSKGTVVESPHDVALDATLPPPLTRDIVEAEFIRGYEHIVNEGPFKFLVYEVKDIYRHSDTDVSIRYIWHQVSTENKNEDFRKVAFQFDEASSSWRMVKQLGVHKSGRRSPCLPWDDGTSSCASRPSSAATRMLLHADVSRVDGSTTGFDTLPAAMHLGDASWLQKSLAETLLYTIVAATAVTAVLAFIIYSRKTSFFAYVHPPPPPYSDDEASDSRNQCHGINQCCKTSSRGCRPREGDGDGERETPACGDYRAGHASSSLISRADSQSEFHQRTPIAPAMARKRTPIEASRRLERVVCQHEGCGIAVSRHNLTTHMSEQHGVGPIKSYKCPHSHCPYVSTRKTNMRVHMRVHSPHTAKKVPCTECDTEFSSAANMRRHMRRTHGMQIGELRGPRKPKLKKAKSKSKKASSNAAPPSFESSSSSSSSSVDDMRARKPPQDDRRSPSRDIGSSQSQSRPPSTIDVGAARALSLSLPADTNAASSQQTRKASSSVDAFPKEVLPSRSRSPTVEAPVVQTRNRPPSAEATAMENRSPPTSAGAHLNWRPSPPVGVPLAPSQSPPMDDTRTRAPAPLSHSQSSSMEDVSAASLSRSRSPSIGDVSSIDDHSDFLQDLSDIPCLADLGATLPFGSRFVVPPPTSENLVTDRPNVHLPSSGRSASRSVSSGRDTEHEELDMWTSDEASCVPHHVVVPSKTQPLTNFCSFRLEVVPQQAEAAQSSSGNSPLPTRALSNFPRYHVNSNPRHAFPRAVPGPNTNALANVPFETGGVYQPRMGQNLPLNDSTGFEKDTMTLSTHEALDRQSRTDEELLQLISLSFSASSPSLPPQHATKAPLVSMPPYSTAATSSLPSYSTTTVSSSHSCTSAPLASFPPHSTATLPPQNTTSVPSTSMATQYTAPVPSLAPHYTTVVPSAGDEDDEDTDIDLLSDPEDLWLVPALARESVASPVMDALEDPAAAAASAAAVNANFGDWPLPTRSVADTPGDTTSFTSSCTSPQSQDPSAAPCHELPYGMTRDTFTCISSGVSTTSSRPYRGVAHSFHHP